MPGKRLRDPSLIRTNYPEAVANGAEILTDWDGLVWARPIPLKLVGNSWWQGGYDGVTWDNFVQDDHMWLRVSTDGGETWRILNLSACDPGGGDTHPPVTIGNPDGGLVISGDDTQVLTLNPSSAVSAGSMSAAHWIKLTNLKFDYLENIGGEYELYKTYYDVADDRYHQVRTLAAGANTTLSYVGDTIVISSNTSTTTGQANTGHNDGTVGYGPFDRMNGEILEFRNLAPETGEDVLTVRLDDIVNNIHFGIVQENIDHDILENFVINEHIDHSTVSIITTEGIQGGGDLTASRTLLLDFINLTTHPDGELDDNWFAVYDFSLGHHYKITLEMLKNSLEIPDTTTTYTYAGAGLGQVGTPQHDPFATLRLDINNLSTGTFDPTDGYIAFYDSGDGNHYKALLNTVIGTIFSLTEGPGIDLTPDIIVSEGIIGLALPLTITDSTTNNAGTPGTGHTHDLEIAHLISILDVDNTPATGEYLKWNGTQWETDNPAIGATSPGDPNYSIQYNNNGVFGGNAGLLYIPSTDTIQFNDPNTSSGQTLLFGTTTASDPYIKTGLSGATEYLLISNQAALQNYIKLDGGRIILGDPTLTGDTFLHIRDGNNTNYANLLKIDDLLDAEMMRLDSQGDFYLPSISSATADNVLYFDVATGKVTYGSAPEGGGGGVTLVADTLSGLMVDGGDTSSASTIELDQNDNKLTSATPLISDYIGFYDVSSGLQSKTLISNLPGWDLYKDGVLQEQINPGEKVNFAAGANIVLSYDDPTNTLTIEGNGSGSCNQSVVDLGSLATGTAYFDLDTYAGAIIELTSGGTITISMDNLVEGDTGHIEVTHSGLETLVFTAPAATAIHIANNSYQATDIVKLSGIPTIDVVVFWFAKGLLHLAVIYNSRI